MKIMTYLYYIIILLIVAVPSNTFAQRTAKVHGIGTYTITIDNPISLMEAKERCLDLAKAEAIVDKFGRIISDVSVVSDVDVSGKFSSDYYGEITSSAKGIWIKDTKEPQISVSYVDDKLQFKAEVWGEAREITQAPVEFKWSILCGGTTKSYANKTFKNKDRLYVSFQSPKDGYVAVYMIESTNEVDILLPTGNDPPYKVKRGTSYVLFDTNADKIFRPWLMTTKLQKEQNQIVIIFSTKPFDQCVATRRDSRHPDIISSSDFKNWLSLNMRYDSDMCVAKDVITIINE